MGFTLNRGQAEGVEIIGDWYRHGCEQLIEMSGPPGSGKTTVIRTVIESLGIDLDDVIFAAYVGKATLQMRQSGLSAKTIHSTFYRMEKEYEYDEWNRPVRLSNGRLKCRYYFKRKPCIPNNIRLIVIDEAGMVPDDMLDEILDFGLPIVCVGDKDQLPPVFGSSRLFKNPDVVLTEIMRQAKGSPIIDLALAINKGEDIKYGKWGKGCHVVDESYLFKKKIYTKSDIIICGKNKTREKINNHVRYNILGRKSEFPVIGDKMVCRKNNWNLTIEDDSLLLPLTNGMFGEVTYVDKSSFRGDRINIDFLPEHANDCFYDLPIDLEYLFADFKTRNEKNFYGNGNLLEYAYASTCQLAQGSQYGKVVVIEEYMKSGGPDYHKRWLYTAVTRAKYELVLIKSRKSKPKKLFKVARNW